MGNKENTTDDLNKYLTWGNVIKVIIFLCTPIFIIAHKDANEKTRDMEIKNIDVKLEEIKIMMNENNKRSVEELKELHNRVNDVEKRISILEYTNKR